MLFTNPKDKPSASELFTLALSIRLGNVPTMPTDVTQLLNAIETGDSNAAEQLLPLVYQELRRLAAVKMAGEQPGQTIQATALVHEAYLKLVKESKQQWRNRSHFFAGFVPAWWLEAKRSRKGAG